MKPKELIDMLPYGYARLRNHNGSVALTLDTPNADAFVFLKRILKSHKMPEINQRQVDLVQVDFGKKSTIIDWFDNVDCRYFISMPTDQEPVEYRLLLHASFGEDTFEITGYFSEKESGISREKIFNERYLKKLPPDALTTQTDFTEARYDIIFPDDPLSHCRRLADVISMKAFSSTGQGPRKLENHDNSSLETLDG